MRKASSSTLISTDVARGAELLRAGGLVAFPTETVYGLGADAANAAAVSRIFTVKRRPADHPLIVHIGRAEDIASWAVNVPDAAWLLAQRFWPGPLTLVLRRHPSVLDLVTGGQETVGLRVPGHPIALALLERFGSGIAAPSANRFGRVSPTEAAHVAEELGGLVDLILDGGRCQVGVESTIVDLASGEPAILRPGGIPKELLEDALKVPVPLRRGGPVRSSGQHPVHYAPRARVVVTASGPELRAKVERFLSDGARVAVMSPDAWEAIPQGVLSIPLPSSLPEMARDLYRSLRLADRLDADVVVALCPPTSGLGLAIADRLQRAARVLPPEYSEGEWSDTL
jgi:L-threonylcarbamoyladenylate synthase